MKLCYTCKIEKSIDCFNKNKRNKDGLATECRDCKTEYLRIYRLKNKEQLIIKSREFKEANREEINKRNRERYLTKILDDSFMARKRKHNSNYKKRNRGIVNSNTAKRYAAKKRRIYNNISEIELHNIKQVYSLASILSKHSKINFHVDHIIPMQGELVSGLHTLKNLQILSEFENCSKNNNYTV